MKVYKILVVDDEEDLCEILQFNLEVEGYRVDVCYSAEEALLKEIGSYDLLLLDVMMGQMSGFKLARKLKEDEGLKNIPIMFLTAKDTEEDKLLGFNIGADDYISKPFSIREVVARVKAVLRRSESLKSQSKSSVENVISFEKLEMFVDSKKVLLNGHELALTKKEFEILRLFLENKNRVFSREEILNKVWTDEVVVLDRTIDVNMTRLRKKIGEYGKYIITRLGYGYCFEV